MSNTNSDIAEKLQGALDKLSEVINTLENNDDSEYENLETLTQPIIEAVDALAEAIGETTEKDG